MIYMFLLYIGNIYFKNVTKKRQLEVQSLLKEETNRTNLSLKESNTKVFICFSFNTETWMQKRRNFITTYENIKTFLSMNVTLKMRHLHVLHEMALYNY